MTPSQKAKDLVKKLLNYSEVKNVDYWLEVKQALINHN
jgi:hypothetical protein